MAVVFTFDQCLARVNTLAQKLARPVQLVVGFAWAAGLMLLAMLIWRESDAVSQLLAGMVDGEPAAVARLCHTIALALAASGQFFFLYLFADEVMPRVPTGLSNVIKLVTGSVVIGATVASALMLWAVLGWGAT